MAAGALKSSDVWFIAAPQPDSGQVRTDYMATGDAHRSDSPHHCIACGRSIKGMRWEPPYEIEYDAQGSRLADIGMRWGTDKDVVVTPDAFQVIADNGITGLRVLGEGKIVGGTPRRLMLGGDIRRVVLEVSPALIRVDERASKMIRYAPAVCFVCCGGTAGYGPVYFERPFQVPIPDVFLPYNLPGSTCVSDKFKQLYESRRFSGLRFIHPLEYAYKDLLATEVFDSLIFMEHLDDPDEYLRKERAWLAQKQNPSS